MEHYRVAPCAVRLCAVPFGHVKACLCKEVKQTPVVLSAVELYRLALCAVELMLLETKGQKEPFQLGGRSELVLFEYL